MTAALLSFALLAAVFIPLERSFPARRPDRWLARLKSVDTLFFFGQYLFWTSLAVGALALLQPWLSTLLPPPVRDGFRAQPAALQIAEAVFLADLCVYWFHRACHRFEVLWRFHAVHHSAPTVDWLAAHREHPLDGLFTHAVLNVPLLMLGVPLQWLAGLIAFRGLWAIFVHSNVRLPLGPLLYVFGAPELHRWHHAREGMARHNFANLAPYMDLLFGTFHRPRGEEAWDVGLAEQQPSDYVGHLMSPFGSFKPLVVGAAVLLVACGGSSSTTDAGTDAGSTPSYKLSGLPDCGTVVDAGTVQDLNDILVSTGCASGGCHGATQSQLFGFSDPAGFRAANVNVKSAQVPDLNRITPGDPNASYTLYKLVGQHRDAGFEGLGERMPQGGPYLDDAQLCRVLEWVRAGAR